MIRVGKTNNKNSHSPAGPNNAKGSNHWRRERVGSSINEGSAILSVAAGLGKEVGETFLSVDTV